MVEWERQGRGREGQGIVEPVRGHTFFSRIFLCAQFGHKSVIVTPGSCNTS